MRARLVRIGRSKGVRLSKAVLKATGITEEVEIRLENNKIVLTRPGWHPRAGWAEDARRLVQNDEEEDIDWENFDWPEEEIIFTSPATPSKRSRTRRTKAPQPRERK